MMGSLGSVGCLVEVWGLCFGEGIDWILGKEVMRHRG
jgi:hypothetical protein